MKLRIKGNTLRLRLTRSEVARLSDTGRVEDAIAFGAEPGETLTYALEASPDAPTVGARLADGRITVRLPADAARRWVDTDQVGIEAEQRTGAGDREAALQILVEKDWACIDGREVDADAFPNPLEEHAC
ncbi:MAG TPA: hypothetical protein VFY16_14430 [Gemmatimonadaceae bacterium]|nr:hypothetical protein [Gemmatimonadaceae bacterium]